MKNSFLRTFGPSLTIGLNDEDVGAGSGGGDGSGGAPGGEPPPVVEKPAEGAAGGAAGDAAAKAAEGAKAAEAVKAAAAELGKSYEKWDPKLPEGMPFDKARFGDYRKLFSENGIKPEVGQKLVDAFANGELGRLKQIAEGMSKERAGWQTSLKTDKELAGEDGKGLDKTMATARRAMQKFATPEFRKLLASSGLEGHPEMVRLLSRAGGLMKEDGTAGETRSSGKGPEKTTEQKMKARYNNPTSQEMFNREG